MFMRVVNLLTFKGLPFRVGRGKGKRRDLLSPNNPKDEWQTGAKRNRAEAKSEAIRDHPNPTGANRSSLFFRHRPPPIIHLSRRKSDEGGPTPQLSINLMYRRRRPGSQQHTRPLSQCDGP